MMSQSQTTMMAPQSQPTGMVNQPQGSSGRKNAKIVALVDSVSLASSFCTKNLERLIEHKFKSF